MRFFTIIAALLMSVIAAAPAAAEGWWKNDWPYRKTITVDTSPTGTNISGTVGRTVVLVRLHSGNFGFTDSLPNGADLRFVAADDKTPLPFHVEKYDQQNQIALVWVSVPNLNGGEKQNLYLYYGNSKAPVGEDIAGTFDPDYGAVFHFGEGPGQPAADATANKNNTQGAPAGLNDSAIIARGARFPGNAGLTIADAPSLAVPAGGGFTFSAWVKPDQLTPDAQLFTRGPVVIGLAAGVPYISAGGGKLAGNQPLKQADWSYVAAVSDGKALRLYVNGIEAAAGSAALPAMAGPITLGTTLTGEMDEVRLSKVARPPAMILAEAVNQGPADKLITFGADEKQGGGANPLVTIIQNTPLDAWIVISILGVMLTIAIWVMSAKAAYLGEAAKANKAFMKLFRRMDDLVPADQIDMDGGQRKLIDRSPIKHLYDVGMEELELRRAMQLKKKGLSAETIEAMRASVDAQLVEENEKLDKWMVLLTIAISGGPFIGLLGTVLGVMITFGAVAAAGEVNVNAIAPGIAAALLATVAGLAVAIPALFGYNYLNSRVVSLSNEMRVFVDRLITRLAETHHHSAAPPPIAMAAE